MKAVAAYGWSASLYSVPWCMVVDNLMVEAARLVENPESGESLKKGIEMMKGFRASGLLPVAWGAAHAQRSRRHRPGGDGSGPRRQAPDDPDWLGVRGSARCTRTLVQVWHGLCYCQVVGEKAL